MSLVIGAWMDGPKKRLGSWIVVIAASTILSQQVAWVYWHLHGFDEIGDISSALAIIGAVITSAGLSMGWALSVAAKKQARGEPIISPIKHDRRKGDCPPCPDDEPKKEIT